MRPFSILRPSFNLNLIAQGNLCLPPCPKTLFIAVAQVTDSASLGLTRKCCPKTTDRQTFALGEDIPLHIALENFRADDPVVGMTPLWDRGMVVTIDVFDAYQNPIKRSDGRRYGGHGHWLAYEKGVVVPMEETLTNVGLLPTEPGSFTVTVTWSPHTCTGPDCGRSGGVSGQPYATVQDTVSFDIVAGNHPQ